MARRPFRVMVTWTNGELEQKGDTGPLRLSCDRQSDGLNWPRKAGQMGAAGAGFRPRGPEAAAASPLIIACLTT